MNAQAADLGVHAYPVCESLLVPLRRRVAIRIPFAPHERVTPAHADERVSRTWHDLFRLVGEDDRGRVLSGAARLKCLR